MAWGVTVVVVGAGMAVAAPPMMGLAPPGEQPGHAIVLRASLMPGISPGTSRTVHLTASNSGASAVAITGVRLVDVSPDAAHATCVTDDFTMSDIAQRVTVPGNARAQQLHSGALAYENTNVNQDACKGATLTLTLSSTNS